VGLARVELVEMICRPDGFAALIEGLVMPARVGQPTLHRMVMMALMKMAPALLLVACERETETAAPAARPVRTITVEKSKAGEPLSFIGRIEAEDEVALAFRISGRLLENNAKLGDRVQPGQVVARLESQNELNTLRQAQAGLAAARAQLTQARNHFDRQETLLEQGWTTRANFDVATQAQQTAQSQVDTAEAQLKTAHDLVSFTELKGDAPGAITAVGPGAGEVVQAGQMIVRLARKDDRDALFDVPAQVIRSAPSDPQITVSLTDDPTVTARGRVREVAAQAKLAVAWGKTIERMDSLLRQWPAAGVSLLILAIALGADVFAR
jgi:membrane fusion protein, multidrug efflux system